MNGTEDILPVTMRTEFDFKLLLLSHLQNLSRLVNFNVLMSPGKTSPDNLIEILQMAEETTAKGFILSVEMMEALLHPYQDSQYKEALNETLRKDEKKEETPLETKRRYMKKLAILMDLMDRSDLLLEKTKGVKA